MVRNIAEQVTQAIPVAIAAGLFVLTYTAVNQLNIDMPPDVSGLVWA